MAHITIEILVFLYSASNVSSSKTPFFLLNNVKQKKTIMLNTSINNYKKVSDLKKCKTPTILFLKICYHL